MKNSKNNFAKLFSAIDKFKIYLFIIAIIGLIAIPFLHLNNYIINIIIKIINYIIMALGLNILVGMTGLVSLGQAGFVAIGAYTTSILMIKFNVNFFLAIIVAIIISAIAGFVMGLPTLRLKGTYLSIITLGFGEIIRTVIIVWEKLQTGH